MATAAAFPFILGERAEAPLSHPRDADARGGPWPDPLHPEAPQLIEPHADAPLTELAAMVERADSGTVLLRMESLSAAVAQRTSLAVLRRRADRRGKSLLLVADTREQRRLAASAGLDAITAQDERVQLAEAAQFPHAAPTEAQAARPRRRRSTFDVALEAPGLRVREAAAGVAPAVEIRRVEPFEAVSLDEVEALLSEIDEPAPEEVPTEPGRARSWLAQARHVVAPVQAPPVDQAGASLDSLIDTAPMEAFARDEAHFAEAAAPAPEFERTAREASTGRRSVLPLVAFGLLTSAALLLVAAIVPSARVDLSLATESWTGDIPVTVDPGTKKPDLAHGRLPGRAVSKELSDTAQAPATGKKIAPDGKAGGEVVFINKTAKPVAVPKGTAVLAGAVRFLTLADVNVPGTTPAGSQQMVGMQRVSVQAALGGTTGNVERFQINKIEGPFAPSLDVRNDAATRGGSERPITYVTTDDRKRLQESLFRSLSDRLSQQLKGQLPAAGKETAVPWTAENPAVVEATFSKNADEEAATVSLTMKVRYGATVFSNDAYNAFVQQAAAAKLRTDKSGAQVLGTVEPQAPQVLGVDGGQVRLAGHARATVTARVDASTLRSGLANKPLSEARAFLDRQPGLSAYRLATWPGFLGRMPWLGLRIAVNSARAGTP